MQEVYTCKIGIAILLISIGIVTGILLYDMKYEIASIVSFVSGFASAFQLFRQKFKHLNLERRMKKKILFRKIMDIFI